MKYLYLLIFLLFFISWSNLTFSQTSYVLDASVVNEKFLINQEYIDIGPELYYKTHMLLSMDSLELTKEIENSIKDKRGFWKLNPISISYCYLFDEPYTWSLRVFREIDIQDHENIVFVKGSRSVKSIKEKDNRIKRDTVFDERLNLVNIIVGDLKNGHITPYEYSYFEYDTIFQNQINIDQISKDVKYINIKEDWRYNKSIGTIECFPIGLGLLDKDRNELIWFYYPELKLGFYNRFIRFNFPENNLKTWGDIIENHDYKTNSVQLENHKNRQISNDSYKDNNAHRNEYSSLFQLELIDNHIKRYFHNYTGVVNSQLFDGRKLSGKLINGVKQGEWKVKHKNDVDNIVVNYINNVVHGAYCQKNIDEIEIIKGTFNYGLKEGEWLTYFDEGSLLSKRNYTQGMLDGAQKVWYKSGQTHLIYNYKGFELNGLFQRWDDSGQQTEKGMFKDDYFVGKWDVSLKIPKVYIEIIKLNPNQNWGFNTDALQDGYLSYTVNIEQINDPKYCLMETCLKLVSFSEIK